MSFPGKIVKEFPPSPQNSRNSEGDFIRLDDGRIAFVYTRFRSSSVDGGTADLAVSFSSDGGESFSAEKIILSPENMDAINIMSVSLVRLNDGQIGLFYLKKFYGMQCIEFMRKTRDFTTFSEEIRCFDTPGYYTVNNQRIVRLSSGNLIIPASYNDTSLVELTEAHRNHNYEGYPWPAARGAVFISEDDGNTWKRTAIIDPPWKTLTFASDNGLQEPGIVELEDKTIYMYFRNASGRQLQCFSKDGGYTWSDVEPSRFTSPPSPMSTLLLSNGNIVVGYNPVPLYPGRSQGIPYHWTGGRSPYLIELCDGNLRTITPPRAIETDEHSGFCYCAFFETNDAVLLGYCAGGSQDLGGCLTRLRIRKIAKEDLY